MLSRMASRPNQHMSSCWHLPINLSPLLLLAWLVPFWQAASPSGFPGVASVQLRIVHEGMLSCKTRRATTAYFLVSRFCFPAWAAEMTLYVFLSCFLADLAELQTQQQNTPKHSACLMLCFRPPKKNSTLTVTHDSTPMATFYWIVHTSKYLKSTSGQEREHWLRHEHDAHLANRKEHTTSRLHQLNQALQELGQRRKSNPRRLQGSIWVSSNVFDKMQQLLLL